MGYFKERQLELLEAGFSVDEANEAIARSIDPVKARNTQRRKLREFLQQAADERFRVRLEIRYRPASGKRLILGVSDRFVETDRGAVNLDLITKAARADREEAR